MSDHFDNYYREWSGICFHGWTGAHQDISQEKSLNLELVPLCLQVVTK